jgi:hypothetical protein
MSESKQTFSMANAYLRESESLAQMRGAIDDWRHRLGPNGGLQAYQWAQLIALTRDYKPDLIIQFGHKNGHVISAFLLALNSLKDKPQSSLLCISDDKPFQTTVAAKIQAHHGQDLLSHLYLTTASSLGSLAPWLSAAGRVLIFWQQAGASIASCIFGDLLPGLRAHDHQLIVHELTDLKYHTDIDMSYDNKALWTQAGAGNSALNIAGVHSPDDRILALSDFSVRNNIPLHSGEASLHDYFNEHSEEEAGLKNKLGQTLYSRSVHWYSLSLTGIDRALHFPSSAINTSGLRPAPWTLCTEASPDSSPVPSIGAAMLRQCQAMARLRPQLKALDYGAWRQKRPQWAHFIAYILEYQADLILEIGPRQPTGLLKQLMLILGQEAPCELLSLCMADHWEPSDADDKALSERAKGKQRVLIFWQSDSYEVARWLLGYVLPIIQDRDHVVIATNLIDTRCNEVSDRYDGQPLWKSSRATDSRLRLGHIDSDSKQALALLDFTTRNQAPLHSADYSLRTELANKPQQLKQLQSSLGVESFSLDGRWFYFSLNEAAGGHTFPERPGEVEISAAPEALTKPIKPGSPVNIPSLSQALKSQLELLVEHKPELVRLNDLVSDPGNLSFHQWIQIFAYAVNFKPDLIIELGRGRGNSTCLFTQAANILSQESPCQVLSLCNTDFWHSEMAPSLRDSVPADWFDCLTAERCDILSYDMSPHLANARRVLVFWDAHGFEIADWVLGHLLPKIKDKDHVLVMHDISDSRYHEQSNSYHGHPLWNGIDAANSRLRIGHLDSAVGQSVAIVDFTSRNRLPFYSADESLQAEIGQDKAALQKFLQTLGSDGFSLQAHWFYFSLNEAHGPLTFPACALQKSAPLPEPKPEDHSLLLKLKIAAGVLLGRVPIDPLL